MREEDDENSLSPNRLPAIKLQTESDFQKKAPKRNKLETVDDSDEEVQPQIKITKLGTRALRPAGTRTLQANEMVVDPGDMELDELGNPLDYFNIYKRKLQELAHEKFDSEKDNQFFSYLDRLVNAEDYKKKEKSDGMAQLRDFVVDK